MFCIFAFPPGSAEEHLNHLEVCALKWSQARTGKMTFSCGEMQVQLEIIWTWL